MKKFFAILILIVSCNTLAAQRPRIMPSEMGSGIPRDIPRNMGNNRSFGENPNNSNTDKKDSLMGFEHRHDDTVVVSYKTKTFDVPRLWQLDYFDFYPFFPTSNKQFVMGNNGGAVHDIVYQLPIKVGFDMGLNMYNTYKYNFETVPYFISSKPYTELNYQIGSGKEQLIKVIHTQTNRRKNGFGLNYRLINSPGYLINQNSIHRNFTFYYDYQTKNKRAKFNFTYLTNLNRHAENGGLLERKYKDSSNNNFFLPVKVGNVLGYVPNPFITSIRVGNIYRDNGLSLKFSYDFGKKDSMIINDTTLEKIFYPRFRLIYSLINHNNEFNFIDKPYTGRDGIYDGADSLVYKKYFNLKLNKKKDSFEIFDGYRTTTHAFNIRSFPDLKNSNQYIDLGLQLEQIKGIRNNLINFFNTIATGRYINKTKNKQWNIDLSGNLYVTGNFAGDFLLNGSIEKLNKKNNAVKIFGSLINKSAPLIFTKFSKFNLNANTTGFKGQTQITSFGGEINYKKSVLSAKNILLNNLFYFKNYTEAARYNKLINIIQANAKTQIKLRKNLYYFIDADIQVTDNASPIKVPLALLNQKILLSGNYFKNLNLNTGIEIRYHTPFKALDYSPFIAQMVVNPNNNTLSNKPDVHAFAHFNIRSFIGFLRLENLNTFGQKNNQLGFRNFNFVTQDISGPGLFLRFGFNWVFVN